MRRRRSSAYLRFGQLSDGCLTQIAAVAILAMLGVVAALGLGVVWSVLAAWPVMLALGVIHGWVPEVPATSYVETLLLLVALRMVTGLVANAGVNLTSEKAQE